MAKTAHEHNMTLFTRKERDCEEESVPSQMFLAKCGMASGFSRMFKKIDELHLPKRLTYDRTFARLSTDNM